MTSTIKSVFQLGDTIATLEHPTNTLPPQYVDLVEYPDEGRPIGKALPWVSYVEPVPVFRVRNRFGRTVASIRGNRKLAERIVRNEAGRSIEEVRP